MEVKTNGLKALYEAERTRLLALPGDVPEGVYGAPVFGEGAQNPVFMLVGEAPGAEEAKQSRPFVGKAGRQLDDLLALAGIAREDIFITNAVKYRPVTITKTGMRNRTPARSEVNLALPLLREELLLLRPRIVATLGNTPLYAFHMLAGKKPPPIGELHGQAIETAVDGFSFTLFPLYHPASVIYNRALLPVCEADTRLLGDLVNNR